MFAYVQVSVYGERGLDVLDKISFLDWRTFAVGEMWRANSGVEVKHLPLCLQAVFGHRIRKSSTKKGKNEQS